MTKNDIFFKILIAVEIALLPMVVASDLMNLPTWGTSLLIGGVLVAKIWVELFKDKHNFTHKLINSLVDVLVFVVLLVFLAHKNVIETWLAIVVSVLIVLFVAMSILLRSKVMPEMIEAVDYCFTLFVCLTLLAFAFTYAFNYLTITHIGLFALSLSAFVSVAYKVYYCIRYKNIFRK